MPAWTPPPDVSFDHRGAAEALAEAAVALLSVTLVIEAEEASLADAGVHWVGRARDATDRQMASHLESLRRVAEQLRRLVADFGAAIDDSAIEQQRRDRLQDRWLIEEQVERLETELGDAAELEGMPR